MTITDLDRQRWLARREQRRAYLLKHSSRLFREDGSVKLPRMTDYAISVCARRGICFTRQPTLERAFAVIDAVRDRLAGRQLRARIRISHTSGTFGVYLLAAE